MKINSSTRGLCEDQTSKRDTAEEMLRWSYSGRRLRVWRRKERLPIGIPAVSCWPRFSRLNFIPVASQRSHLANCWGLTDQGCIWLLFQGPFLDVNVDDTGTNISIAAQKGQCTNVPYATYGRSLKPFKPLNEKAVDINSRRKNLKWEEEAYILPC